MQTIREQEDHVLLLDAGDVFQGTPYFNKFKGVLEMKVMQEMGYDAMTLGNHDFDIGIEGFVNAKQPATFPIVNCNYNLDQTLLKDQVSTSIILKKAGRKIGITGVGIDLNHLSLNTILGSVFSMFAWVMGVPAADTFTVGSLMGTKMVINEFVAYSQLTPMITSQVMAHKSIVIASFALCGFANFSSIAIQVGGIGELAPSRRSDLARLGFRALACGTLASYLSATIAGMMV